MKKFFTTVLAAMMALSVWAEAPQTISYQAVVRNNVGRLHRDKPVGVRITILSGSENGQVVYSETRTATTNNNGLLTFAIGDANANAESSYDLSKVAWAENTYYLRCEMDPDGGNTYTLSSTSQMNSVPYALYAKNIAPEALPSWAQSEEKPVYNYTEIQGAPTVPTKVSELQNDANYITLQQVPTVVVPTKVSELQNDANYLSEHQSLADYAKKSELPAVPTKVSELTNDVNYVTEGNITTVLNTTNVSELVNDANYATTADVPTKVSQLTNDKGYITAAEVPVITVPTKVSAFENDKNYLTEHQSLADYAKKSELPSTAGLLSEADAAATYQPKGEYLTEHQSLIDYAKKTDLPTVPTKVSELTNDANYVTEGNITTVLNTTNVSELVNDANYATTADVPTKVSQLTNDKGYITAEDVPAVSVPTKVSAFENDANYLTEHQSLADYAKKSELPAVPTKVSELTNDANYVTEGNITTVLNTTNVSELVNDANYATTADVPTKVSQLTNDKGYITAAEVPAVSVPTKVSELQNDANYLTEHQSLTEYAKKTDLPSVPTKVSQLTNDAGYITESNVTTTLNTINVSELVNDANYATTADVPTKVSQLTNDKGYITAAEVPAVSVPTKVSAFENDADYAKKSELPSVPTKVSELTNDANYVTEGNITTVLNTTNVSELVNDANYATTADVPTKVSQLTNDKGYITAAEVPAVSVPTKVSAFENDANYLTEHQSLAEYAKKSELPSVPTKVSELTNDANYVTEGNITTVLNTTNVSELVNDANYATTADVPTKVSQLTNDKGYITAADVPAVSVPTKVSAFENDANYLTAHQSLKDYAKKSDLPVVPTKVSAFENDANYLTEHQSLADYAKKSELPSTAGLLSEADAAATYQPKGEYLTEHQSLADYAKKSELPSVPTKVSQLTNDEGYITLADVPANPTKVSQLDNDAEYITSADVPTKVSELTNDEGFITTSDLPTNVSELTNDANYITLAEVPAKVSAFENDAQYITKATFDGIVEGYNDLLDKYKNQLDSMRAVMEKDKRELDSMKSVVKNVAASNGARTVKIDNGALPGLFSVSADKKVQFSMGNLQYQATSNTWRFAENQYDYVGENNANIASDYDGWIDLFGWGTSGWNSGANEYMPYSSDGVNTHYFVGGIGTNGLNGLYRNADWGVFNKISNGGNEPDKWRVLTKNEWSYLIFGRPNANNLFTRASVESVNGFVFFPDEWKRPDGFSVIMGAPDFSSNVWSQNRWNDLEAQGAIFMPCAGYREKSEVGGLDKSGIYWASTSMEYSYTYTSDYYGRPVVTRKYHYAYTMRDLKIPSSSGGSSYVTSSTPSIKAADGCLRHCGYSVRLVRSQVKSLVLSVANIEEGMISGGGVYESGDVVEIKAVPSAGYYFKQWSDGNPNPTRSVVVDADMSLTAYFEKKQTVSENGAFASLFSVSATKQVKFSQGNLQYQASSNTWRFAENQYDVVGDENKNISDSYDGWIDLFGWATSGWENQPYECSTNTSKYYVGGSATKSMLGDNANADWGVYNAISNGGNVAGQWRTLSSSEWTYLYSGRTNAAKLRTKATVSGIAGFVFFPDTWTCPDDVTVALDQTNFTTNDFSPSAWETLENSGAVFLPAAGYRNEVTVSDVGTYGYYWSSNYNTSTTSNVNYFYFYGSSTTASSGGNRYYGRSVRLVQE